MTKRKIPSNALHHSKAIIRQGIRPKSARRKVEGKHADKRKAAGPVAQRHRPRVQAHGGARPRQAQAQDNVGRLLTLSEIHRLADRVSRAIDAVIIELRPWTRIARDARLRRLRRIRALDSEEVL